MDRCLHWCTGSLCILTIVCTTTLTTKQVLRKVFFPSSLTERIPFSPIKMTFPKKTLYRKSKKHF